ncbi:MAG: GNAT family N-acetyltransferase [Oscillospiraceae bacterium]|nr:GNAT family N-acetyltransferase [Oscillospiraceae bacterium]
MRNIRKDELRSLSVFIAEQFYEIEPFQTAMEGIEPEKAKRLIAEKYYWQLSHSLFGHADIFVGGEDVNSVIIGIDAKGKMLFNYASFLINLIRIAFKMCSKSERKLIMRNLRPIKEVQSTKWFKKYSKVAPYYLALFAIEKSSRGSGLCREMLEYSFNRAKTISSCITLETHSKDNAAMYEHFGFELVESIEAPNGMFCEYRMIKRLYP